MIDVTLRARHNDMSSGLKVARIDLQVLPRKDVIHLDALAYVDEEFHRVHLAHDCGHENFSNVFWSDVASQRIGVPFVASCGGQQRSRRT